MCYIIVSVSAVRVSIFMFWYLYDCVYQCVKDDFTVITRICKVILQLHTSYYVMNCCLVIG